MYRHASLPAVCAAAFAFAALSSSPTSAASGININTYKNWDGSSEVSAFGCPNTTTYGETITVPAGATSLEKFSFEMVNLNSGSMVLRGEVYAWDGSKATGSALWEGKPRTISFSDGLFHKVTFKPGVLPVTAGQQYVLFASIDKDFEQCQGGYVLGWGFDNSDVYSGGGFVYQNNGGDESQWTLTPWNTFGGSDVAFRARFH